MSLVETLAVVGEGLDDPAAPDFPHGAPVEHQFQLGLQRIEADKPTLDIGEPRSSDGVR